MGHSRIRAKVRRRKVAALAAYSRQFTVNNSTIPQAKVKWNIIPFDSAIQRYYKEKYPSIPSGCGIAYTVDDKGKVTFKDDSWVNKKGGYPQPKSMMKKHVEWIYNKETHMTEKVLVASTFPDPHKVEKLWWKNLGKAAKMEFYAQDKLKKWEKKHPKPCPEDDLFKDEYIPKWEADRETALERFRDFVVSMFDKLPLSGRFKQSESTYVEKHIADISAKDGAGHNINEADPKKSKTLKKAQEITNKVHAKRVGLVSTNLKDHKRKKGRILLPKAA